MSLSVVDARAEIDRKGYFNVPFTVGLSDREAFARAGNAVISLAEVDEDLVDVLTCNLMPGQTGQVRGAFFSVSGPRNSGDQKIWMHTGYQSRVVAADKLPERNQPYELRHFWTLVDEMLHATEVAAKQGFEGLSEQRLMPLTYPEDLMQRNIILRTIRYIGARALAPGTEAISGHIDLGIGSLHIYETHGNWFQAAPVPPELIGDKDTPERRQAFREIREKLKIIQFNHDKEVPLFMGASYTKIGPFLDGATNFVSACYHAGFRPVQELEAIISSEDSGNDDRLALLAFIGPSIPVINHPNFVSPTVRECRPAYE